MRKVLLCAALVLAVAACDDDEVTGDGGGLVPQDGGPDVPVGPGATGAACSRNADCAGGACLGMGGGLEANNPRFHGGYCTTLGCTANSQEGCGPDEWCIDGGGVGTYCVELCSKADGLTCDRADHVCLGLGTFGGCFSNKAVECDSKAKTGCMANELCVRIGFDDPALGRCEPTCDPMRQDCESSSNACYYVRRYNTAFCVEPGTTQPEELCMCDKCCIPGYACTPDTDGSGRHCKKYCVVSEGCAGGTCVPLEPGSPWGGCVTPGSAGT